jgi:diacylglycerol kinase (ATP)
MYLIVSNPRAGGGEASEKSRELEENLKGREIPFFLLPAASTPLDESIRELRNQFSIEGIFVAGGDGTVHQLIQILKSEQIDLPVAILPAGSGNDFARSMNIFDQSIDQLVELVVTTEPQSIDLIEVNGTWVAQILSTGFDAQVNKRANDMKALSGKTKYTWATILEIRRLKKFRYNLILDGASSEIEGILLGVANGGNYGGGLNIVPHASQQDGIAELFFVKPISRLKLLLLFPLLFFARHIDHPDFLTLRCRSGSIVTEAFAYGDGEPLPQGALHFHVKSNALRVWRK